MSSMSENRHDGAEPRRLLSLRLAAGVADAEGAMLAAENLGLVPYLSAGVRPLFVRLDVEPRTIPIEMYASQCQEAGMAFSSGLLAHDIRHVFHCDGSGTMVFHLFLERDDRAAYLADAVAALSAALGDSFPHAHRIGGVARGAKEIGEACRRVRDAFHRPSPKPRDEALAACAGPKVREAIAIIRRGEGRHELTIGGLAAAVGLTPAHFSRIFRGEVGVGPLDFLTDYRIGRAKELLRNRDLRVHDVALASGFDSTEYFARVFRRRVGMTPTEYRGAGARSPAPAARD